MVSQVPWLQIADGVLLAPLVGSTRTCYIICTYTYVMQPVLHEKA